MCVYIKKIKALFLVLSGTFIDEVIFFSSIIFLTERKKETIYPAPLVTLTTYSSLSIRVSMFEYAGWLERWTINP